MNAFPIPELIQDREGNYSLHCEGGLTNREIFAAIFLHASISICNTETMMRAVKDAATRKDQDMDEYMARESVKTADRLLKALGNTP